jgi:DNA repair protein RadC
MKKLLPYGLIIAVVVAFVKYRSRASMLLGKVTSKPPKVELKYSKNLKPEERIKITSSSDVAQVLRSIWSNQMEVREEFIVLLLDRGNHVLGYHLLSRGGLSATVVDMKILFSLALNSLASAIILAHNHPSGNLKPSESDIKLTKAVDEAGKKFEIQLLDHLIITKNSYYSFLDNGDL